MLHIRDSVKDEVTRVGDISVTAMMQTVARAYLAAGRRDAVKLIRTMNLTKLMVEYHWAVAALDQRGLLTAAEQREAHEYARDYLASPAGSVEA